MFGRLAQTYTMLMQPLTYIKARQFLTWYGCSSREESTDTCLHPFWLNTRRILWLTEHRLETLEGAQERGLESDGSLCLQRQSSFGTFWEFITTSPCAYTRAACSLFNPKKSLYVMIYHQSAKLGRVWEKFHSLSCLLLLFHYSASGCPCKTTRTSLLVGFHHFCFKMKLTIMKNSWIKKKFSKQISKPMQTIKN